MTDAQQLWGPAALEAGLRALGYEPRRVATPQNGEYTVFDYEVEIGPKIGESVQIGLQAPPDFPVTPPPGPNVSPPLGHPGGNVHGSGLGDAWRYWSRPAPNWAADRTVDGYLRHVRTLFSQLREVDN